MVSSAEFVVKHQQMIQVSFLRWIILSHGQMEAKLLKKIYKHYAFHATKGKVTYQCEVPYNKANSLGREEKERGVKSS